MGTDKSPDQVPVDQETIVSLQRECEALRRHNTRLDLRTARNTRMKMELLEMTAEKVTMLQQLQQFDTQSEKDAQRINALQAEVQRLRGMAGATVTPSSTDEYATIQAENRSLRRSVEALTHQLAQQAMIEVRLAEAESRNRQMVPLRAELEAMYRQVQEVSEEKRQLCLRLGESPEGVDDDSVVDFRRVA